MIIYEPKIEYLTLPENRRIIAISDIHGNLEYLRGLLEKLKFSTDDILFIVGDMLEKGPDSLGTLHYIMELSTTHDVHVVMGNCDDWHRAVDPNLPRSIDYARMYLLRDEFRYKGLLAQMLEKLDFEISEDMDMLEARRLLCEHYAEEFWFLSQIPHIIETQKQTFVHGGPPLEPRDTWDAWKCMKNDNFLSKGQSFDKWTVVGHWPVVLYGDDVVCANPIILADRRIISLDGGCVLKDDGQLNAIIFSDVNSDTPSYEYYDHFRVMKVMKKQKASEKSAYFRYGDNIVEIMKLQREFTRCRHCRTGYEMDILTRYLTRTENGVKCNDCTDYILPLEIGDEVSIIEVTSRGFFVKHRGISGWYYGDLV